MRFVIEGVPRTKKTSQRIIINRNTKLPMVIPAKNSKDWEKTAIEQLLAQGGRSGWAGPVSVRALIYRESRRGDLCGYFQAIGDALQGGGSRSRAKRVPCVLLDDSQIQSWDGSRPLLDKARPRVELTIEPMEGSADR